MFDLTIFTMNMFCAWHAVIFVCEAEFREGREQRVCGRRVLLVCDPALIALLLVDCIRHYENELLCLFFNLSLVSKSIAELSIPISAFFRIELALCLKDIPSVRLLIFSTRWWAKFFFITIKFSYQSTLIIMMSFKFNVPEWKP